MVSAQGRGHAGVLERRGREYVLMCVFLRGTVNGGRGHIPVDWLVQELIGAVGGTAVNFKMSKFSSATKKPGTRPDLHCAHSGPYSAVVRSSPGSGLASLSECHVRVAGQAWVAP